MFLCRREVIVLGPWKTGRSYRHAGYGRKRQRDRRVTLRAGRVNVHPLVRHHAEHEVIRGLRTPRRGRKHADALWRRARAKRWLQSWRAATIRIESRRFGEQL